MPVLVQDTEKNGTEFYRTRFRIYRTIEMNKFFFTTRERSYILLVRVCLLSIHWLLDQIWI